MQAVGGPPGITDPGADDGKAPQGLACRFSLVDLRVFVNCASALLRPTIGTARFRSTLMLSTRIERHRSPPTPPRFYRAHRWSTSPHVFAHELLEKYGDFVCWRGFIDLYLVNHPDFIRPVLSKGYEHFSKRTYANRVLALGMGAGLVTNDGPHWASQRRLLQPLFSNRSVNRFDEAINGLTHELMCEWDPRVGKEAVWVDRDMSRLALRIVGATLFGADFARYTDDVAEIMKETNVGAHELRALLLLCAWLPVPSNLRWKRANRRLDAIVYEIIGAHRREGAGRDDIVGRLLAAGDGMDERQIRDEVATLMLAGHETSAIAIAWTLYLLATHPDIDARLAEELNEQLDGAPATASDLSRVPYLKQVVQESMRIYPPAWGYARRSGHEEEFGEFVLPAKSEVTIVTYALHRHREFWPDPERFDPDRFRPDRSKGRHSYCYLPFGAGPRACIGASMAMLEIQLVLAQVLQRFTVHPVPGHPIETIARVTLKPRYGIPVTLRRRQ